MSPDDKQPRLLTDPAEIRSAWNASRAQYAQATGDKPNLCDLAAVWAGTAMYDLTIEGIKLAQLQMTNYAWSCNVDGENDWYFVNQLPLISPMNDPAFVIRNRVHQFEASFTHSVLTRDYFDERGVLGKGTVAPTKDPNGVLAYEQFDVDVNPTDVVLEQPLPMTTKSSKTYTSGVDWNLSGTVGYSAKKGASGSVTGGIKVSNSVTTSIDDVTITNHSASPLYSTNYDFVYSSGQALSTFQTTNSMIFHMPTSLRKKVVKDDAFTLFFSTNSQFDLMDVHTPMLYWVASLNTQYSLSLPVPPIPE